MIREPIEQLVYERFLNIRPAKASDLVPLQMAASQDGGQVISPSQVLEKNGEIVGYIALATVATSFVWLHKEKMNLRDNIHVLQFTQNMAMNLNAQFICFPVEKSSKLHPLMEKAGFTNTYNADLFIKPIH